jgi:hypothetical protein
MSVWSAIADSKTGLMYAVAERYYCTCTIRKEQQQALTNSTKTKKLRLILENISEGIIVAEFR